MYWLKDESSYSAVTTVDILNVDVDLRNQLIFNKNFLEFSYGVFMYLHVIFTVYRE